MKVKTAGTGSEIIRHLGGIPVNITVNESYNAFQRGTVDAVYLYNAGIVSYRLHELGKYLTIVRISTPANAWAWNKKFFDGLPQELKTYVYNMQRRVSAMYGQGYDFADERALEVIKGQGIEVINLAPDEVTKWKAAVEPMWQEFINKNEALGLPVKDLVKDLRELSKKYSSWTPEQIMERVTKNPTRGIIDGM